MKKKLALLLALIMIMSLAPVTIFAASTNRLSRDTRTVPKETLLYDDTITDPTGAHHNLTGTHKTVDDDTISSYVPGMDLVLDLDDSIKSGDAFRLTLDNAEWFFESDMRTHSQSGTTAIAYNPTRMASGAAYTYTYTDAATGLPYEITLSSVNRKSAVVKFNSDHAISNSTPLNERVVRIPLLVYIKDESVDVTVSLVDNSSPATAGSYLIASSRAGTTISSVASIKSGRESIALDTFIIKENRSGSLNAKGAIELVAPAGYAFRDKFSSATAANRIKVISEYGMGVVEDWGYKWTDTRDHTSVALYVTTASKSTGKIPGSILIEGLVLEPLDYDVTPNIGKTLTMAISNYENGTGWMSEGSTTVGYANGNATKLNVKGETIDVAKVVDWTVTMSSATPRTLIGGRYPTSSTDDKIKAAKVTFTEEELGAWISDRTTTFTLPTGVKILAVKFDTRTNLSRLPSALIDVRSSAVSTATRYTEDLITIQDGSMTIKGLVPDSKTVKSKMEFTLYLSIEPSFEGPVTITSSGTALPQEEQTVTIAEVMPAIIMTSRSKNVQIGYQSYAVNDITITETSAGALLRDGALNLKVYDYTNTMDILFAPITQNNFTITEGDIRLTLQNTRNGIISFNVDRASTTPATIEITGLSVRIDRSVPYGSYDVTAYGDAVFSNFNYNIAGTRVNPDLVSFRKEDEGVILPDYIKVATEGANAATQSNVRITANSNVINVGGESVSIEVAPFIDPESNSFLVPVRFVAIALGIPDTNIFWDQETHTATIISADNSRTMQFVANSDIMVVNGARQTMVTNGYNVRAKIVNDRMFIPFRYVGVGLGLANERIVWNEATQTAEFNPVTVD